MKDPFDVTEIYWPRGGSRHNSDRVLKAVEPAEKRTPKHVGQERIRELKAALAKHPSVTIRVREGKDSAPAPDLPGEQETDAEAQAALG